MNDQLYVQTCWDGSYPVSTEEITDDMIYGFRRGGCAALARELLSMIPDSRLVVFCEQPPEDDMDAIDLWGHAAVLLPTGEVLDIGGLDSFYDESWGFEYVPENLDVTELVWDCPAQPEVAVRVTAELLIQTVGIRV